MNCETTERNGTFATAEPGGRSFLLGGFGVIVSNDAVDGFSIMPWVVLSGLVGMIVGRRHHATRIADADALHDLQAARAKASEAALEREAQGLTAQRTQSGRNSTAGDGAPKR